MFSYATFCSGIESPSVAWSNFGWRPVFFSEIEPFCCELLRWHYPHVPNLGDMLLITDDEIRNREPIDLLIAGTPCQGFSVAGLRGGMDDPRSQLALRFLQLADVVRPRWLLWENVPGAASTWTNDQGNPEISLTWREANDLRAFTLALEEIGYQWALRILDAQHFGVPQRRRRIFLVGYPGDWRPAAAVLFERNSLQGDPAPGREEGEEVAGTLGGGSGSRGWCDDLDRAGAFVPETARTSGQSGERVNLPGRRQEDDDESKETYVPDVAYAQHGQAGHVYDGTLETLIAYQCHGSNVGEMGTLLGVDNVTAGVPFTICEDPAEAVPTASAITPTPFDTTQITSSENRSNPQPGDPVPTLSKEGHPSALAWEMNHTSDVVREHKGNLPTLTQRMGTGGNQVPLVGVRRLTPLECERAQGLPDNYTQIWYRKGIAKDSPRYRAIGNSIAVPVLRWIGRRIEQVERHLLKTNIQHSTLNIQQP